MTDVYRVFGSELSPYSVKVRSYFRFKGIPHQWVVRSPAIADEFQRYARLPLIPLVITPSGEGLQDSTPIIEHVEALFPEPSIHPTDLDLRFLSALIEEYADEWGNKPMFHYRWWRPVDQRSAAERIARGMAGEGAPEEQVAQIVASVQQRMSGRLPFVGSSAATQEQIEGSFARQLDLLEAHLAQRPYLFGERPALADFGWWGQVYELSTDPTPGAILRARAPCTMDWVERMLKPEVQGEFDAWETLAETREPIIATEIAAVFLPWSTANARALEAGSSELEVTLLGQRFTQQPQKYHARS